MAHAGPAAHSMYARAAEKSAGLGRLGRYLLRVLTDTAFDAPVYDAMQGEAETMSYQASTVEDVVSRFGAMAAAALATLCTTTAMQVPVETIHVKILATLAFTPLPTRGEHFRLEQARTLGLLEVKRNPAALAKTNLWFSEVLSDAYRQAPDIARAAQELSHCFRELFNDQAASVLLMAAVLRPHFSNCVEIALQMLREPEACKQLTAVLKSLGANRLVVGAALCEGQVLQGRGVAQLDVRAEALERVGVAGLSKAPQLFTDDELRHAVRMILEQELDMQRYRPFRPGEAWSSRWRWCANGGHGRARERTEPEWAVGMRGRVHRRVAVEHWTRDPTEEWNGQVYVSAIEKLEHGKSRLLLSCDSVSYVVFEDLLKPVEKAWRNKEVLMDPGARGSLGTALDVRDLGGGTIHGMLDYDDFNAQHTIKAQQIVIEETGRYVDYDPAKLAKLVSSFGHMQVFYGAEKLGTMTSTLASGHRATSFVNGILNKSYVQCSLPRVGATFRSLHTGDDVVGNFNTYDDAEALFSALRERGVRLNPIKQSVGAYTAEFLRMAITPEFALGYAARSVATLVSGSWTNEVPLEKKNAILNAVTTARALTNRSGTDLPARLCTTSVARATGMCRATVARLLVGTLALDNGPIYGSQTVWQSASINEASEIDERLVPGSDLPAHATQDYLAAHAQPIELMAFELVGSVPARLMQTASYAKSLAEAVTDKRRKKTANSLGPCMALHGSAEATELLDLPRRTGALLHYPLLALLRDRLSDEDLITLIIMTGESVDPALSVREQAWGELTTGALIRGALTYSDAASLSARTDAGIIYTNFPVYM